VRGQLLCPEKDTQLKTPVQERLRGSGGPLPLVSNSIEPETHGKVPGMSPEALLFYVQGACGGKFMALCQQLELGPKFLLAD